MLYRRRTPPEKIFTPELARQLTELSRLINRQLGILINRQGEVVSVIVGDHRKLMIPSLEGFRSSSVRFKGLRLIHTHLNGEALTNDDLTDLALLRLDLVCALEVKPDGLPGPVHLAYLIPENPEGKFWIALTPAKPAEIEQNFLSFIQALEGELTRKQKSRRVDLSERAILIRVQTDPLGDPEAALDELAELARSCGVEVFDRVIQQRPQLDPKFILGKGKLSDVVIGALQIGANLLIFDHELSPAQVRSIGDFTEMRVIDRTQVILDIFARRALTREGKIQVELAQLKYMLPKLVTKNTAMSRLTGGIGGTGPGETKLEINRRRVRERINHLEKEIEGISRAREQRRMKRGKQGLPVVSIVGYTNAGKSTLLNALTASAVFTENRLFATLDPKTARLRFPQDTEALITDTVGFIRDLPQTLMAAFRATLDELNEADVLLHVIDVSNPRFEEQITSVERILAELDLIHKPTLRIFNKSDLVTDRDLLEALSRRFQALAISALKPETLPKLVAALESFIREEISSSSVPEIL